jgi:hypothetical protein
MYGDIKWCLTQLIEHEKMMRKVGQLWLEVVPVGLLDDQLMHCGVAIVVDAVVVGVNQVASDVTDRLFFDLGERGGVSLWSHGRIS